MAQIAAARWLLSVSSMLNRLVPFIVATLAACADNVTPPDPPIEHDASVADAAEPDAPPASAPRIVGIAWQWQNCPPNPTTQPLRLAVTVDVASTIDHYTIRGQAVGCEPFTASGQAMPCLEDPGDGPTRTLSVTVESAAGQDIETVPLVDCVDGKWEP